MQEIKLLAMDVDGTLVKDAHSDIAQVDRDAIKRAQAAGVKVTLSTGRIFNVTRRWLEGLSITEPEISINGADIRTAEKTYYLDDMPLGDVVDVLEAYRGTGISRYVSADNLIYYTEDDVYPELHARWDYGYMGKCPVRVYPEDGPMIDALSKTKLQKVLLWAKKKEDVELLHRLALPFRERFTVVRGDQANLEFNCRGTSKGSGLIRLAKLYGFGPENTMAIGDGGNDVDIIRTAGVGVAMGNAMTEALDAADYVTADVEHGGVAQAIDKFIFGKE